MTPEQMQEALKIVLAETEAELALGDEKIKRLHTAVANLLRAKLADLQNEDNLLYQFAVSGGSEKLKAILGLGDVDLDILERVFRDGSSSLSLRTRYQHCIRANTVAIRAPLPNRDSTSAVSYDLIYQAAKKGDELQMRAWAKEGVYLDPKKWITVSSNLQVNRLMLITPAGQLAREGAHASVALLRVFNAANAYIVRGYASTADHQSCNEWMLDGSDIVFLGFGYFYSTTQTIPKLNYREDQYQTLLASLSVRNGLHEQVEECRKRGADVQCIAQYYVLAGLDAKVDEYHSLHKASASLIAARYAKQGNHERVAEYAKKGAAIDWIIDGYAEVENYNLVEAYRTHFNISMQDIANAYCQMGQFQKVMGLQKSHALLFAPLINICNNNRYYYFASRLRLLASTAGVENILSQDALDNIGFDEIYQAAKRGDISLLQTCRQAQVMLDPRKIITWEIQLANQPVKQLKLRTTPAGKLAREGDDAAVEVLRRVECNPKYIAEGYAAALNYEKCEKFSEYIGHIHSGYIIAGELARAASAFIDKKNLPWIAINLALNGNHAEVAECHRKGVDAEYIVQGYYRGGYFLESEPYEQGIKEAQRLTQAKIDGLVAAENYKKLAEYSQDYQTILLFLAQYNRHGYVQQYHAQFGGVDQIAAGYAQGNNLSKVQQWLFAQGASLESIAIGFSYAGEKNLAKLYNLAASAAKKEPIARNDVVVPRLITPAIEAELDGLRREHAELIELRRENTGLKEIFVLRKDVLTTVAPTTFFAPSNATSVAPPPQVESKDLKRKVDEESDHPSKKR